ncbi:MAG: hypothetical protein GY866_19260, partial [Proteobacteria bacterium]|nr:hypothetical protein [Pseudomonadota bacterium]
MGNQKTMVLESAIGKQAVDSSGSPVGVVRMDAEKSYSGTGELLRDHLNDSNQGAWDTIKGKIDYMYESLDLALGALESETDFKAEIATRLEKGQKLFFKPNLVFPFCITPGTHEPGNGLTACTDWGFVAALMRWFHDKLGVRYHQMALGEAATATSATAGYYSMMMPDGSRMTTEAVIEGKSGDFY